MALVGNKADLHEKREVPTEVSLRKRLQLDSVEHFVVAHLHCPCFFSGFNIFNFLTGWDRACREKRHVLY